jgi:hypothetical protein
VVSFTPRGKGPLYPLDKRLDGRRNSFLCQESNPAVEPVAVTIPTELSRYTYKDVDRRIILKLVFEKGDGGVRAGFSWLKIGTSCGLMSTSGSMKDGE